MRTAPELLTEWRSIARLTQTEAAERCGVTQPAYSDWEAGRKAPLIENALAIADATGGLVPVEAWARKPAAEPKGDAA